MFGVGWSEFLVVILVAVMAIGPKDIPRVLYTAGKFVRKIRKFTSEIQKTLDSVMHEEEMNDIIREANKPGGDNLQFEIDRQAAIEQVKKQDAAL